MNELFRRIVGDFKAARNLYAVGATLTSIWLYPLRRRTAQPYNRIDFRTGLSLSSPRDVPLHGLVKEIWIDRCYTPENLEITPGEVIVDIGANVGVFSIWMAAGNPQARVVAVEPAPEAFEFLQRNVSANQLRNVSALQAACAGRAGEAVLYRRGGGALHSLYDRDVLGSVFQPLCRARTVTLAQVFEHYNVKRCTLLKLDCEGAEYEILYNAGPEALARTQMIAMEYHIGLNEHRPEELCSHLETHGFRVTLLPPIDEEGGYLYASRIERC